MLLRCRRERFRVVRACSCAGWFDRASCATAGPLLHHFVPNWLETGFGRLRGLAVTSAKAGNEQEKVGD